MGPSIHEYPVYLWQLLTGFRSKHERMYAFLRHQDTAHLLAENSLQVLDLGNGRLRPQYTLLKAAGHRVFGIDLSNRPAVSAADLIYKLARRIFCWKSDVPKETTSDRTLVCGNVVALPFRARSFDLVTSIAAFEHFLDVPAVLEELARVVRPRGLVWACIHPFTCPSGGHNVSFTQIPLRKIRRGTDAWDHLRHRKIPLDVPLNEWRLDQYLEAFAKYFEVIKHYCALREGGKFLTPEIAAELSHYSVEELTCHAYVIIARKLP
jgi:SAM-dependent methyltransferase